MFKCILIYILLVFNLRSHAFSGDSLRLKPSKHNLDISYGNVFFIGERDILYSIQLYSFENYSSTQIRSSSINYSYLILKTKKTSKLFYLGGGINYAYYTIRQEIQNKYYKYYTLSYNTDFVNYKIKTFGISLHIENVRYYKNFCFTHRFGISYMSVLSNKQENSYEITTTNSRPYQDPAISSQANPGGWTWDNSITTDIVKDTKLSGYHDYLTPFYNVGFGYRIKHLIPYATGEFSFFDMDVQSPTFKIQAGIKLIF